MTEAAQQPPEPAKEPEVSIGPADEAAVDEVTQLKAALAAADAKVAEAHDQSLRARAEVDNIRKRAERDVASARKYALESFASEMLGICDSLELGLAAAGQEGADVQKISEGMRLTQQQLVKVMERFQIKVVDPVGQPFNPDQHQAISMQESTEAKPNTVLQVMQKGYLLNDRLLRPAMVIVAKAPSA